MDAWQIVIYIVDDLQLILKATYTAQGLLLWGKWVV